MEIRFDQEYLANLYYKGKTHDKKHRFQPEVIKRYRLRIETLAAVDRIEDLFQFHSFHYKVLEGDKKGISSIRVNNQYRIEFRVSQHEQEALVTICNILELSNHYQ